MFSKAIFFPASTTWESKGKSRPSCCVSETPRGLAWRILEARSWDFLALSGGGGRAPLYSLADKGTRPLLRGTQSNPPVCMEELAPAYNQWLGFHYFICGSHWSPCLAWTSARELPLKKSNFISVLPIQVFPHWKLTCLHSLMECWWSESLVASWKLLGTFY